MMYWGVNDQLTEYQRLKLATKLYIPLPRSKAVLRPRLIERLNEYLQRKLRPIYAPADFGKTNTT